MTSYKVLDRSQKIHSITHDPEQYMRKCTLIWKKCALIWKKGAQIWRKGRKYEKMDGNLKKTCAKEGKYTNSEKSQQYEVYKLKFWKINQAWNSEKSMIMWIPWIHNETDGSELWTLYYIWIHHGVKIEVTRKSCLLNTLPFMLSLFREDNRI